jgi:predicted dehydrogenase
VTEVSASRPVRLALLGCGAVAELCHLPGAARTDEVRIVALVDRNLDRAKALGTRAGISRWTTDYREVLDEVDGVINALPHHLHATVTTDCLGRGVAVLVEKPMARTLEEAKAMVAASAAQGTVLQVALMNRFCDGARIMKRAVDAGWLGPIRSFDVEWGFVYDWPVASGFFFNREQAGGGVLMDLGSHVLDLLIWWLGDVEALDYADDSRGGVEADCAIAMTFRSASALVHGTVTLSRLRALRNTARIVGERFTIECDITGPTSVRMWPTEPSDEVPAFVLDSLSSPPQTLDDAYAAQLNAFGHAVATHSTPAVSGEDVLASVAVLDRCYRERRVLVTPWGN